MYLILSDIHGNLSALESILNAVTHNLDGVILLGDNIDYGMRSNEVLSKLSSLDTKILVNIWGNHEYAILNNEYESFSTERGVTSAKNTSEHLNSSSIDYLLNFMSSSFVEFRINDTLCLAIHGSLDDIYWKSLGFDTADEKYMKYDIVFSGHSHQPHYFEKYYPSDNPNTRHKKKTVFVNPGSVGQPRNLNPNAQGILWDEDAGSFVFLSEAYDIVFEQSLFVPPIDSFYRDRLEYGV